MDAFPGPVAMQLYVQASNDRPACMLQRVPANVARESIQKQQGMTGFNKEVHLRPWSAAWNALWTCA